MFIIRLAPYPCSRGQSLRLGAVAHGGNPHRPWRLPLGEDRAASPKSKIQNPKLIDFPEPQVVRGSSARSVQRVGEYMGCQPSNQHNNQVL